jgi:hypothetical protein
MPCRAALLWPALPAPTHTTTPSPLLAALPTKAATAAALSARTSSLSLPFTVSTLPPTFNTTTLLACCCI